MVEVHKHNNDGDCWIVIDNLVYDVSKFLNFHPGSKGLLLKVAGTDCSEEFWGLHRRSILDKYNERLVIGHVSGTAIPAPAPILSEVPFAEWNSPFYTDSHRTFKLHVRKWVNQHIMPHVEEWERKGIPPPPEFFKLMGAKGFIACSLGPGPHLKLAPKLPGGVTASAFDYFHESILHEELKRIGSWGLTDGIGGGLVIGLPPVLHFGKPELVNRIVPSILRGEERICLAITDPYGGSDVANITATAEKSADGTHYVVNGVKKWITMGCQASYFTTLVRTGGPGAGGLSLLLIERGEGVTTDPIKTSYSAAAGTAYVTFENVKVPIGNLLGREGDGFVCAMMNFIHERWAMAVNGNALNRLIVEECFKWAYQRKVFGKPLIHQPQIQEKLSEMIAYTESVQAWIDIVTHRMTKMSYAEQNKELAGTISLLKNQQVEASRKIADHAVQIFGGRALTASNMGVNVERFLKSFQFGAILGGASSVLATQAIRHALKSMPKNAKL